MNLISNDVFRCFGTNCDKKETCKRFLQLDLDRKGTGQVIWVAPFKPENCVNYLPIKTENGERKR